MLVRQCNCRTRGTTYYEFDANGNQTAVTDADGTTYYHWTPTNRLSRVDLPGGTHSYFYYDGAHDRVRKDDSGGTVKYTWDALNAILERNADDQTLAQYAHGYTRTPGIGSLVARSAQAGLEFFHQDHIGSTMATTDGSEATVQQYEYAPFGRLLNASSDPSGQYLMSGKLWDADAGLYHFVARHYDPFLGRFVSLDPAYEVFNNPFIYGTDSPLRFVDPDGRLSWCEGLILLGLGLLTLIGWGFLPFIAAAGIFTNLQAIIYIGALIFVDFGCFAYLVVDAIDPAPEPPASGDEPDPPDDSQQGACSSCETRCMMYSQAHLVP